MEETFAGLVGAVVNWSSKKLDERVLHEVFLAYLTALRLAARSGLRRVVSCIEKRRVANTRHSECHDARRLCLRWTTATEGSCTRGGDGSQSCMHASYHGSQGE